MFDRILETLGSFGNTWAIWLGTSILDAAITFALAGVIWLLVRKKASAQFGYCLFLLVLLKLLVPLEVVVPKQLARWTPAHLVSTAITAPPTAETASVETKLPQDRREPLEIPLEKTIIEHVPSKADAAPIANPQAAAITPPLAQPLAASQVATVAKPQVATIFACLMLTWAAGAYFLLVRFLIVQIRFHRRLKEAEPLDMAVLDVDFAELCARIGIRRPVRVVESEAMASPAVWGIRRPVVILPRGMAASLSAKQLEWILLHELAHIRRHDLTATCFQRLITIVHFLNPAVWVANRMINRLREYACDDVALSLSHGSPIESGEAFMHVVSHAARNRPRLAGRMDAALGVFDSGGRATCFQRMSRLLDTNRRPKVRLGLASICTLLLAAVLTLPQIRAGDDSPGVGKTAVEKAKLVAKKGDSRRFELTVVGPEGKAIENARVEVRMRPVPNGWNVAPGKFLKKGEYGVFMTADSDGRLAFELPERIPNSFVVFIRTKGYGPFCARWDNRERAEPIPAGYTARLDAGRSVGGIVVDGKDKPIRGVTIWPSIEFKKRKGDLRQFGSGARATTDAQGKWRYDCVPAAMKKLHISINHPEYMQKRMSISPLEYDLKDGAKPMKKITLGSGVTVTGKITDLTGKPIEGAVVRTEYWNAQREATTDKGGVYRLVGCEAVRADIVATAKGRAPDLKRVKIAADMRPVDFKLEPGHKIRVRVLDTVGKPIARARIFLQSWRGDDHRYELGMIHQYTDKEGVWEWNEAPSDAVYCDICPPGGMTLERQKLVARDGVHAFQPPPTLVISGLTPALVISGRVIDAETKESIKKFRVVPGFYFRNNDPYWPRDNAFDAHGGKYRIKHTFPRFAFMLRIEAAGYRPAVSRNIKSNEGNVTVDFKLQKAADPVVVITPQGEIANNATVAVCTPQHGPRIEDGAVPLNSSCEQTTTDAKGRFNIVSQDGIFALMMLHESGVAYVSQEKLKSSKTIKLEPWARVEGTLLIGGKPAAGEKIGLNHYTYDMYGQPVPKFTLSYRATTDKDGHFEFEKVVPCEGRIVRYTVTDYGQSSSWIPTHSTKATFTAGKTTRVKLARNGRPVVGKLIMAKPGIKTIDWSYANVSLRELPRKPLPQYPEPPWPEGIDPGRDREAAEKWLNAWRETAEGKLYQEKVDQYHKNRHKRFQAKIEEDGSFTFVDIPAGDYMLSARLPSMPKKGRIDPGEAIATLSHKFTVPKMPGGRADEPLDLGELELKNVSAPKPRTE